MKDGPDIKRLVTEHVMGWRVVPYRDWLKCVGQWTDEAAQEEEDFPLLKPMHDKLVCVDDRCGYAPDYEDHDPESGPSWEPLLLDRDAFKVASAMVAKGYAFGLWQVPYVSSAPPARAAFTRAVHPPDIEQAVAARDQREAICRAALVALGVLNG